MRGAHPLATSPSARVVFIDGQNLYQACRRLFGHPLCHPHLLAEWLVGPRVQHAPYVRFYTGRANPNMSVEAKKVRNLDRRLRAMERAGVLTIVRPLRYHWDWGHREALPTAHPQSEPRQVTLAPWQRPQEKGIDLVIALDVIEFMLAGRCDVAIVVSLDRDLCEIPRAFRTLRSLIDRPTRLEAAIPVAGESSRKTLEGFHYTHRITPQVFQLIRDDTDYTVDDDRWKPPVLPTDLAQRQAEATASPPPARDDSATA